METPKSKRTFYLGLGAQKAGTTWLFRQIQSSDRFAPGLCKEYHLFDYIHLDASYAYGNAGQRIANFAEGDPSRSMEGKVRLLRKFYENERYYYDYIDELLDTQYKFTCDITPAYALLNSDVLSSIRQNFEERAIELKVIYLMREPVSRLESELRMALRRKKSLGHVEVNKMCSSMTKRLSIDYPSKSNYSFTVKQIDEAFPPSQVFYCFYEDLFLAENIEILANFFNIPRSCFNAEVKVNVTRRPYRYTRQHLEIWAEALAGEYEFARTRFGFNTNRWKATLHEKLGQKETE